MIGNAVESDFDWETHPELDKFVNKMVTLFLTGNSFGSQLSTKMRDMTSTRFVDWIDHMIIPTSMANKNELEQLGMQELDVERPEGSTAFKHMASYLFPILLGENDKFEIAIKPESLDDFLQVLGLGIEVNGAAFSHLRKATISQEGTFVLSAVERRGYGGFVVKESRDIQAYLQVLSALFNRRRNFDKDDDGVEYTQKLIDKCVSILHSGRVSDAFFRAERAYWQKRNRIGQAQKDRQDRLGLGWGNHDHHTYRSSRQNFTKMINIFERMGYSCREKYYAGERAGWGAQILEHESCNIVVFTDVDLNSDETSLDFAHVPFTEKETKLGTVGLWIGLHGESILQAGMHHLEARFDFEKLTSDLQAMGMEVMPPFSHFDFLKQAFTKGEVWKVDQKRLDALLAEGLINQQQYDQFLKDGAIGSHMENLERDQGFKGFNKASVTKIIMETDPRKQHFIGA